MTAPARPAGTPATPSPPAADLRSATEVACAEARAAEARHAAAEEQLRTLRRDLLEARREQTEVREVADPALRTAEKEAARDAFRLARIGASDEEARRELLGQYAGALSRVNRGTLRARRALQRVAARLDHLEAALHEAERAERAERSRAQQAQGRCLEARVRLAAGVMPPTGAVPLAPVEAGGGLVIESLLAGDEAVLASAAARLAGTAGREEQAWRLGLRALVGAIMRAAAEAGHLVPDQGHRFWSTLSAEESRDVIGAFGRLGFSLEPTGGWAGGRIPTPSDLGLALAYAGLDARNLRDLPSPADLRDLPASVAVDGRAFLAARAPDLTLERVVAALGGGTPELEPLWDEWGAVLAVLLAAPRELAEA